MAASGDEGIDGGDDNQMRIFSEFGHVREEPLALYALGDLPGSAAAESAPSARGFAFGALSRPQFRVQATAFFFRRLTHKFPRGP